jgi:signal transduction histidine kinase
MSAPDEHPDDSESLLRRQLEWLQRERAMLSFEIHDGLVQEITAAGMFLDTAERVWEKDPQQARERMAEARRLLREAVVEARGIMEGLRPASLESGGLCAAANELARGAERKAAGNLQVDVECRLDETRFAPVIESALYRILQEALSNVVKHSGASQVHVLLEQRGEELYLSVEDNGAGFDVAAADSSRFGLRGMRERAESLGGRLEIASQPGSGARLEARLPAASRI